MARMSFAYILSALMIAVAACSGGERGATTATSSAQNGGAPRATVALITHQAPGDTFWDLVRRGAEAAAAITSTERMYAKDIRAIVPPLPREPPRPIRATGVAPP